MNTFKRRPVASWVTLALLGLSGANSALAATPVPGAGDVLQQIPQIDKAPVTNVSPLKVEPPVEQMNLSGNQTIDVKDFNIVGNTAFSETYLKSLLDGYVNKTLTLNQLNDAALAVNMAYQQKGYIYTRVVVPPQELTDGVVTLRVVEAKFGRVNVNNTAGVASSVIQETVAPLQTGQLINQQTLDQQMLLASDIPGVNVDGTLQAGGSTGESDLALGLSKRDRLSGSGISVDNGGGKYTGRTRLIGNLVVANPFGYADQLTLTGLTSGSDTNYGRLAYEAVVDGAGTRVGGAYSYLDYKLGNGLENLQGAGTAQVLNLFERFSLQRSQTQNTYLQFDVNYLQLRDALNTPQIFTDRDVGLSTLSVLGDYRSTAGRGALNRYNLSASVGNVNFKNTTAANFDAAGAKTAGGFFRVNYDVSRIQLLTAKDAIYLAASGQIANKNLDSSQKMLFSGMNGVRAYDTGVASGDRGNLVTLEFRRELGNYFGASAQGTAFIDMANYVVNQDPFAVGSNSGVLRGAGLGLNFSYPGNWLLRFMVATRLGNAPSLLVNESKTRGWITLSKSF